jgi:spore maturation protein CgeB
VIVGSYVPDGVEVGRFVLGHARGPVAFYDIDTPITLAKLASGDDEYISKELIRRYDLYLSFTGGKTLDFIERAFHARRAVPLYCSVDAELYKPLAREPERDLGYLGTYSDDRQPGLERLLLQPAEQLPERRFVVAGPCYPETIAWPGNVERIEHVPPSGHRAFYAGQRFTLNVTRAHMTAAGFSPSVRLFEAAACGTPVISDRWDGIEEFFEPGKEILLTSTSAEVTRYLRDLSEGERRDIGDRARARVLAGHTAQHRAQELVRYLREALGSHASSPGAGALDARSGRENALPVASGFGSGN